jgi:hypothetical protein
VRDGGGCVVLVHFGLRQNRVSGESPLGRGRDDPMDRCARVPTLSLAMEPVFTQLDRPVDDDVRFQRGKAAASASRPFMP